ncbi:hypothetical protein NIES25_55730 (plasmid) [Nostoc linckia NIES-25]|nr:hypothetical protein NIES25_55730 [Nostoc linckia NIES-25]
MHSCKAPTTICTHAGICWESAIAFVNRRENKQQSNLAHLNVAEDAVIRLRQEKVSKWRLRNKTQHQDPVVY